MIINMWNKKANKSFDVSNVRSVFNGVIFIRLRFKNADYGLAKQDYDKNNYKINKVYEEM